jgi:hypothetical protein
MPKAPLLAEPNCWTPAVAILALKIQ